MKEGFAGGSVVKNPPANAGDAGSIPKSERSLGGGNGNLGNPKDRGGWQAAVHGVAKSQTQLSTHIGRSEKHCHTLKFNELYHLLIRSLCCVCVCVCVREREREILVCVCVKEILVP